MKEHSYSRQNLDFLLFDVQDALNLTKHPYFGGHDAESCSMVLDTASGIAENNMRPFFSESDRHPPKLIDNEVNVHKAISSYYKAYCDSGLMTACLDEKFGGQQLPKTIYAAADFILGNAHNGFEMFTGLSEGAARLLTTFASQDLIDEFASIILSGESTATMCLTEPQAGSSLGDIATEASPYENGSYRITGQKIFISAGDHDITENIIHLVLARIKGAPKGIKGISLFVVPKKRKSEDGHLIENDVLSISLQHKMGQRSTPAMHLGFGTRNNCLGHLIGEEGKGLSYMFQMMNTARLGVGLAGTYIASAAYYASLAYANERPQGRRSNNKNPNEQPVTIIHHPDVRRMLFIQKAFVEGSLSFVLQCYKYIDLEKISSGDTKQRYNDLLELLTPVAKTYGAEMGIASVNSGLQVLGGYGYTDDFVLQQLARDVRIMSLYEGTTGIQAQALLGRQISTNGGRALKYWKDEVIKDIDAAKNFSQLQGYADCLDSEIREFEATTAHLLIIAYNGDPEVFLSDATLYIELFGIVNVAWQWLKQAHVALGKLETSNQSKTSDQFYQSKIETMRFYFHYELIKAKALRSRLMDSEAITIWREEEVLI